MYSIVATSCANFPIVKQAAWLIGKIMEGLYWLFSQVGIENIGFCIIALTFIIKLAMLPLVIKQQKFSKVSAYMNPELQAIQRKYKDKRDQASMMKMQEETKAVYEKYGTTPTGSCLQLLIQMPILLALYAVIWNIPGYVPQVNKLYEPVTTVVIENKNYLSIVNDAIDKDYIEYNSFDNVVSISKLSKEKATTQLSKLSNKDWNKMTGAFEDTDEILKKFANAKLTDEQWDKLKKEIEEDDSEAREKSKKEYNQLVTNIRQGIEENSTELVAKNQEIADSIEKDRKKIDKTNAFLGMNLSQAPAEMMGLAILIPILSALFQWISVTITTKSQNQSMEDNPMASSMKVMNLTMPVMSGVLCFTLPAGLGLYWVCNSLFQIIQQVFVNMHLDKYDINDIIEVNVRKQNEARKKKGIPEAKAVRITERANTNVKNIEGKKKENEEKIKESTDYYNKKASKPGSLSAKANMVKLYDERNNKK